MSSQPLNVLLVDDNFDARDFFRLGFRLAGHTCKTAHNGLEALRIITQNAHTFDVIIMDYNMPDMSGLDVVQEMRERKDLPSIPVILFTGDMPGTLEDKAQKLGVVKVLYKPIRPMDLTAAAQDVVLRHNMLLGPEPASWKTPDVFSMGAPEKPFHCR